MITINTTIKATIAKVWEYWTEPTHIVQWYHASDDWHVPYAENDVQNAGKFKINMAAKDGSFNFDFEGEYTKVVEFSIIEYTLTDGRKVSIQFDVADDEVQISQRFDPESENTLELQRTGWQAILDNFKRYTESH